MPSNETRYPYKDTAKIEEASIPTGQKTFKNAKPISSQWLTKKNPVQQMTNPEYHPHKGQVEQ
jgi:hypothetical protein